LIKLAQLLTWLVATLRRPIYGKLSYSTTTFNKTSEERYRVDMLELEPIEQGLCWNPMFANGVIAKFFPVPERNDEVGLEIPFKLMVILGRIWYPMEYLDGFVLKGYSTILIPTLKTQHSVQWHFINSGDQEKRINMSAVDTFRSNFVENIDIGTLQAARTFVGGYRTHMSMSARKRLGMISSGNPRLLIHRGDQDWLEK
jgi:hypothetical protein